MDQKRLKCGVLASSWQLCADLLTDGIDTTRSCFDTPSESFPLQDRLSKFQEDLNIGTILGTNDPPCWLVEACKTQNVPLVVHIAKTSMALGMPAFVLQQT